MNLKNWAENQEKIDRKLIYDHELKMEYHKWITKIPYINFPSNWQVQITPPFAGAVVRFRVKNDYREISVYLDCYDILGYYGKPYWEIYPASDQDIFRCDMEDVDTLLKEIKLSLES